MRKWVSNSQSKELAVKQTRFLDNGNYEKFLKIEKNSSYNETNKFNHFLIDCQEYQTNGYVLMK